MFKTLILLLSASPFLFSQNPIVPYEKLGFENYNEIWSAITIDSSIIDNTHYDGRHHVFPWHNRLLPIETQEHIFTVDMAGLYGIEGGIVQKRGKRTGKLIWQETFDRRSDNFHEWPQKIFIDKNGLLNVLSYRTVESFPKTDYIFLLNHKLVSWSVRKYDIETGNLVGHFFSQDQESEFFSNENTNFIFKSNNGFTYLERSFTEIEEYYVKHIFDEELKIVSSYDTIGLNLPNVSGDILVGGVLQNNNYSCSFDVKTGTAEKPRHYSCLFWDESFDVFDSIPSIIFEQLFIDIPSRFNLEYFDENIIIIRTSKFDGNEFVHTGYTLDHEGQLIQQFNYPRSNGFDISFFHMTYDTLNQCPIFITREKSGDYFFNIYSVCDSTNRSIKLKTLPNNVAVSPINVTILSNGKILVSVHQGKDTTISNTRRIVPQGTIWMVLDGEIFNLKSSTSWSGSFNDLVLYPNPSNEFIKYKSSSSFEKFKIYDMQGTLVISGLLHNNEIDITTLNLGTYIIQFGSSSDVVSRRFVKQ